jgi:RNA polymerase sigma-70 factor (ECF subfamily)
MRDDEFERMYTSHAQGLFAFLQYRTGDQVLSEDLLADTFERALRSRKAFDRRRAGEKTWLYTIALNLLRDHARRRAAEQRALVRQGAGADPLALDGARALEHRDEVQRALAVLSAEEREAVALRFGADLTVPEIASVLDQPLTTVEGRVYRALRKLRGALGPAGA